MEKAQDTDEITDDDLLARLKSDDREAYRMLVDRYIGKLWRLSVSVLYNESEAEDVVQETFFTVWQRRAEWEAGTTKFSTWIYRVTLNRCIDIKRRQRPKVGTEIIEETLASDAIPPADEMLVHREDNLRLMEMLSVLPPSQKEALVLYYYEELNVKEISVKLSTTEEGVRSLLKRGRKTLKELIENDSQYEHRGIQGSP